GVRLGAVATGRRGGARADLSRDHAARTRALACTVVVEPRLDRRADRRGAGARGPHDRRLGRGLWAWRSRQRRVPPDGWSPPALTPADLAALDTAVAQPPRAVGVPVANWNWKAVRSFVADRLGKAIKRSSSFRAL